MIGALEFLDGVDEELFLFTVVAAVASLLPVCLILPARISDDVVVVVIGDVNGAILCFGAFISSWSSSFSAITVSVSSSSSSSSIIAEGMISSSVETT